LAFEMLKRKLLLLFFALFHIKRATCYGRP
jgi:hypothetical protein